MARSPGAAEDGRSIGAAVDAVVFDVFGTVVDWRTGVADEFERIGARLGVRADSNGSTALLIHLARAGRLPFHTILSAELIHSYKPDPRVYRMAAELLEIPPRRLLMTACHLEDLRAAADAGLRTAYIPRPLEWGPDHPASPAPDWVDLTATDIPDLARQLAP